MGAIIVISEFERLAGTCTICENDGTSGNAES